jgi:hypothetical protein
LCLANGCPPASWGAATSSTIASSSRKVFIESVWRNEHENTGDRLRSALGKISLRSKAGQALAEQARGLFRVIARVCALSTL